MNRRLLEYNPQFNLFDRELSQHAGSDGDLDGAADTDQFNQAEQMDLAVGLLEARKLGGVRRFLLDMIRRAGLRGDQAALLVQLQAAEQKLTPAAVGVAQRALPAHRRCSPAHILGLELEGLSPEDQEFEVARGFIRFAEAALKRKAQGGIDAAAAIRQAAQRHAPGLLPNVAKPNTQPRMEAVGQNPSGRWLRQGSHIMVLLPPL
jgi:hypothetical protein